MWADGRGNPGYGSGPPQFPGSFLLAFTEAARGIGWRFNRLTGDIAHCVDADGEKREVGLENLYRRARRTPRVDWPQLAADFLKSIDEAVGDETARPLVEVADRLLIRLGRPLEVKGVGDSVWARPIAGTDLVLNLVIDYPNRMCYVTEKAIAESGHPGEHWLAKAEANLLACTPADCLMTVHEESGMRICMMGDSYDSSRVLLLDHLLPESRAGGNLVVLPGRDELLVLPVTHQAMPHVRAMKLMAQKNFTTAPYPISDQVYWIHEGVWRPLPVEIKPDEVTVFPPPELVSVLKGLAEEAGEKWEEDKE
jgi:hypothetical protein